jgi:hypothetical protein
MRKFLTLYSLILLALIACNHKSTDNSHQVSANVSVIETPFPLRKNTVVKNEGWQIPTLKESVAVKFSKPKTANPSNLSVTEYKLGYVKEDLPVLEKSFFSDEERRTLRLFPSDFGDLVPSNLLGYEINGRKFCYVVNVHPKGVGALIPLYFYDLDGDEKFETATTQSGRLVPDLLPDWAK